jgi:hypothetical protein
MSIASLHSGLMTPRCMCMLVVMLALLAPRYATADTTAVDAVAADVKQVCTQPATQGQHWTVTGKATGNVGLQIKSIAGATGELAFTKEEWSGIQQVLAKDQVGDNESYRECVKTLTPLFLTRVTVPLGSPEDIDRRLRGFLAAKQLAVPGASYGDADLVLQFGVQLLPGGINLSYPTLNGSYRALRADIASPIGHFSRVFAERNGALVGVVITQTCMSNATVVCSTNYADWKSSLGQILGMFQESKHALAGGPAAGPFANAGGTLTQSIAYDHPWRVYLDRLDPSNGGPTVITLIVASDRH